MIKEQVLEMLEEICEDEVVREDFRYKHERRRVNGFFSFCRKC